MNEKRQILLFKALKNGRIDIPTANQLYSGNTGKDALISLEYQDYLEHTGHGNFIPNPEANFPESVVEKYRNWKKSQDSQESTSNYNVVKN